MLTATLPCPHASSSPVLQNVIPLMSTAGDIEFVTETDRTMREREEERSREFDSVQSDLRGQRTHTHMDSYMRPTLTINLSLGCLDSPLSEAQVVSVAGCAEADAPV